MKEGAIFCTIAQKNFDIYLERLNEWKNNIDFLVCNFDLYAICDGEIDFEKILSFTDIKFIPLVPSIGRSLKKLPYEFPGWRRSFGFGLYLLSEILHYKYISFIENDIKIKNKEKIKKLIFENKIFAGSNEKLGGYESSFIILNDIEKRNILYKKYLNFNNICENLIFEHELAKYNFIDGKTITSLRINGDLKNFEKYNYDILAQATYKYTLQ